MLAKSKDPYVAPTKMVAQILTSLVWWLATPVYFYFSELTYGTYKKGL